MARILICEDTDLMRESMTEILRRGGHEVRAFADGREALEAFPQEGFHLVVSDLKLPGLSGTELLTEVKKLSPETPFVLLTAFGTVAVAVEAMKRGAYDFIEKPFAAEALEQVVRRALEHGRLVAENEVLRARLREGEAEAAVAGSSAAMREVWRLVDRVAAADATVLLHGETGTGKEVVAREIHRRSPRRDAPFLSVNCSALSAGLLESELFGHEKGAFTSADRMRKGRFELADGGTLLLDEVSEIDLGLQAKLLRVLQERTFERVGSSLPRRVDVRVIATTNRDLPAEIAKGKFREDLYYRLNVVPVKLPPLRDRAEDVPALAGHFLKLHAGKAGRKMGPLPKETAALLASYRWPGNVRELGNVIERAVVLAPVDTVKPEDIAPWLTAPVGVPSPFADPASGDKSAPCGAGPSLAGMTMEKIEEIAIRQTLEKCGGNRERAAEMLGISSRTLRDKMKGYGAREG